LVTDEGRLFVDIVLHQFDKCRGSCLMIEGTDGIKGFD